MDLRSRQDTASKPDASGYLEYLDRAASYYLGRYATSIENFRRILHRKLLRKGAYDVFDETVVRGWIDSAVNKYVDLAILDDQTYAVQKARSLHNRGKSQRAIKGWLRDKGIDANASTRALEILREECSDLDLAAAIQVAKRKRLGPFRRDPSGSGGRPEQSIITKELGALARAGFSYSLARSVTDCASEDELLARLERPYEE